MFVSCHFISIVLLFSLCCSFQKDVCVAMSLLFCHVTSWAGLVSRSGGETRAGHDQVRVCGLPRVNIVLLVWHSPSFLVYDIATLGHCNKIAQLCKARCTCFISLLL